MNTAQLIVLWYAALLVTAALLAGGLGVLAGSMTTHLIGAIAVLTATLIYSAGSHPMARRRYVALFVVLPPLLLGGAGFGWWMYNQRAEEQAASRAAEAVEDGLLRARVAEALEGKTRQGDKVLVRVPTIGIIRFLSSMTDEQIADAVRRELLARRASSKKAP